MFAWLIVAFRIEASQHSGDAEVEKGRFGLLDAHLLRLRSGSHRPVRRVGVGGHRLKRRKAPEILNVRIGQVPRKPSERRPLNVDEPEQIGVSEVLRGADQTVDDT
jgi:hypothetical protein